MEIIMKKIFCILLLCLSTSLSWAGVIPKAYNYVTLPPSSNGIYYANFTAINARGFAVGYGTRNNQPMTFIFNYYTKTVEHIIDGLYPTAINDHNKIVGIDFTTPNLALKQCSYYSGQCDLSSVEGAERPTLTGSNFTNSDVISANFFFNTPEQKYQIYQYGTLLHSEKITGSSLNTDLLMRGTQPNNTHLFVGARKTIDTNYRPVVKVRDFLGIKELNLPIPQNISPTDKVVASNVNSRNDIIIQVQRGIDIN